MNWVIAVFVGSGCYSGLKEDYIFYIFGFGPWILRILRNAIVDPEQVSRGDRWKGHSGDLFLEMAVGSSNSRRPSGLAHHRKVYSVFSTVFLPLLLLAIGVGFPAACFGR